MKQFLVKKPIKTFKVVKKLRDGSLVPYFYSNTIKYEIGKEYEKDDYSFEKRDCYYSYDWSTRRFKMLKHRIVTFNTFLGFIPNIFSIFTYVSDHNFDVVVLECEIPEGSIAYSFGSGKIASNRIKIVKELHVLDW